MDVADFNVIEDDHVIEADTVEADTVGCAEVTMDAMDEETAHSSEGTPVDMVRPDHWWLQRRPWGHRHEDLDNDTPVPGSNSVKVESEDLVSKVIELTHRVNTLEDLMSKVRQLHEVAPRRQLQLCHCSSRDCFRFANAAGWHTCCWKCGHWGSHYHTYECLMRQANTMWTLVERQELLETIMAKMDQLPLGG